MHASILEAFVVQPQWRLASLAAYLQIDVDVVKRRIALWINRGFIHEMQRAPHGDICFEAPSSLGTGGEARQNYEDDFDTSQGVCCFILCLDVLLTQSWWLNLRGWLLAGGVGEAQMEQEMRVYEQYVVGMLTNLEALPLSRIHNMLRMFCASEGEQGYNCSESELQRFLNRLVEDGKLEFGSGHFKIKRQAWEHYGTFPVQSGTFHEPLRAAAVGGAVLFSGRRFCSVAGVTSVRFNLGISRAAGGAPFR
jgi:anaphase-promoting complex subunit 2